MGWLKVGLTDRVSKGCWASIILLRDFDWIGWFEGVYLVRIGLICDF